MKWINPKTRKLIYRLFSSALAISLCFSALIFSLQAIETDTYDIASFGTYGSIYFEPFLSFGGPDNTGLNNHMRFLPEPIRRPGNLPPALPALPAGMNFSVNDVLLLRAGMVFPDGAWVDENGVIYRVDGSVPNHTDPRFRCTNPTNPNGNTNFALRDPRHRGFHGYHAIRVAAHNTRFVRNNYISAFTLITMIANAGGVIPNVSHICVGLTEEAFYNITSRFVTRNNQLGVLCGRCNNPEKFLSWYEIMEMNGLRTAYEAQNAAGKLRFRRFFIWGIALHALTDVFEHSVAVPYGIRWRMLIRPGYSQAVALGDRVAAAQAAVWEALHVLAGLNSDIATRPHGCCHVFLAIANPRQNTPSNRFYVPPNPLPPQPNRFTGTFRLANLMDYFEENYTALYGTPIGLPLGIQEVDY